MTQDLEHQIEEYFALPAQELTESQRDGARDVVELRRHREVSHHDFARRMRRLAPAR